MSRAGVWVFLVGTLLCACSVAHAKDSLGFVGSSDSRASVMAHVAGNFALKGFVHQTGQELTPTQRKLDHEMLQLDEQVLANRKQIEEMAQRHVPVSAMGSAPMDKEAASALKEALRSIGMQGTATTGTDFLEAASTAGVSRRSAAFMRVLDRTKASLDSQRGIIRGIKNFFGGRKTQNAVAGAKRFFRYNPKNLAQKYEDCMACRYIWSQVEMDVANARYVEDVQASFEHNCLDAQKTQIFYKACEDMYDDMYAMTDDYMANEYTVDTMCKRANLCKTGGNDNGVHRIFY